MKSSLFHAFGGYLHSQAALEKPHEFQQPSITISRETGSGAVTIAELLVERLNELSKPPPGSAGWTVFDSNLAKQVLEDHQLEPRLERFIVEDARLPVESIVEEVLGLHPTPWVFVQKTTKTILRLASLGRVVLVGRGSGAITKRLPYVFHVRLVAPLDRRIQHTAKYYQLTPAEAAKRVREQDEGRRRYLRRYFDAEVEDPLLYDLVINTERLSFERAADLIAQTAMQHYEDFLALSASGARRSA
jgi:cytidylate kinase